MCELADFCRQRPEHVPVRFPNVTPAIADYHLRFEFRVFAERGKSRSTESHKSLIPNPDEFPCYIPTHP